MTVERGHVMPCHLAGSKLQDSICERNLGVETIPSLSSEIQISCKGGKLENVKFAFSL